MRPLRSNEGSALINVVLTPRDKAHETYALSKMNTPITFREEVNLALQSQPTESNPSVLSVSQISRIPGELKYNETMYELFGFLI